MTVAPSELDWVFLMMRVADKAGIDPNKEPRKYSDFCAELEDVLDEAIADAVAKARTEWEEA